MGSAYTPGLTVSADTLVQRIRRLPIKGEVLVQEGQNVVPDTVIARAALPGALQSIHVAEELGLTAEETLELLQVKSGESVEKDQVIAETKGLLGKFFKTTVTSKYTGVVEEVIENVGHLLVREASLPIDLTAYISGKVVQVLPEEGAVVEARAAFVQGIFGVGGEQFGQVRLAVATPDETLDESHVRSEDAGKVLVGGGGITGAALKALAKAGVVGVVVGAIKDADLTAFLGYDIGVAITGEEEIPLTLIATEGFGSLPMSPRTFELLGSLDGKEASMNGATQIRAGVIRPEVIVPSAATEPISSQSGGGFELDIGTQIRIIREPYFGMLGTITELPPKTEVVESGAKVRVLRAKLEGGEEVRVPRANVEIIVTK